jgi:hypothetical protein
MVNYNLPLYKLPQEKWDAKKCARLAKTIAKDGLGTPYHFKGYVGNLIRKTERYNGGTIINGEWWQGVEQTLPKLPKGYKLIMVPTWGWRLVAS